MLDEPFFESLPTSEDFYYDGGHDERWTREHYLGKDIDYARMRFHTYCPLSVLQDWSFVGIRAFRYYILGACRYLQDEKSQDDCDVYSGLAERLHEQFIKHPKELYIISAYIVNFCEWAIEEYEKFGVSDYEDIYGDIKAKYREVQKLAIKSSGREI